MNSIPVIADLEQIKDKDEITSKPLEEKPCQTTSGEMNDLSNRLMTSKIIRIHLLVSDCCKGCQKNNLTINTISRIDDKNPTNENETPLFRVEEICSCSSICIGFFKFHFYAQNSNNENLLYVSEIKDKIIFEACKCKLPDILNYKVNDSNSQSIIKRYDNRTIYRTYEYLGQAYYKIGKPYEEQNCCCCCSKNDDNPEKNLCCCSKNDDNPEKNLCCCSKNDDNPEKKLGCCESFIERSYIDIFNMNDQLAGKFAYCNERNKLCSKNFFEIYFPPEANEMIRISLISQCIFLFRFPGTRREEFFESLPGSDSDLTKFYS